MHKERKTTDWRDLEGTKQKQRNYKEDVEGNKGDRTEV